MRRTLQTILFCIFACSAIAAALIGYFSTDWVTRQLIERNIDTTQAAISGKFAAFDVLLENEEMAMERRMAAALPELAKELLGERPSFARRSTDELAAISRRLGVDNIYIVDRNTVVVATDFAADKGFELGTISPGLRSFLTGLIGTGKFVADRINMSSKTGILQKYAYFSPKGSDHIAEVSIDIRKFLARERSQAFVDFLFGSFFRELAQTREYLTAIDIHMVNAIGRHSLFQPGQQMDEGIAARLRGQDRILERQGNLWKVYSKISPVNSRLSTAEFLAVTTTHDFSLLSNRVQMIIALVVGMMILVSAIAYLLAAQVASRRLIARIETIRHGVSRIADGDYQHNLSIEGRRDEINSIADDINIMRREIEQDIARREADAARLAQAMKLEEEARESAEIANLSKTKFLSSVSHELRTPLQAILGYAQLMQLDGTAPLGATQQDRIGRILKAGEQLSQLIGNILDLAQAEKGVLSLDISSVQPAPVIADAAALIGVMAREREIGVVNRAVGKHLPNLRADPGRLGQVLLNLLGNAVKYSKAPGDVCLDAEEVQGGKFLRISITDNGPGIPKDKSDRLFHWFERLGRENTGVSGVGIGLALCHDLVTRMDGNIGFDNVEGGGCRFWIEIPVSGEGVAAAADLAPPAASGSGKNDALQTVLYIEDNPELVELMHSIFAVFPDYALRTARDGETGLRMAKTELPDVILMDLNLPGMDGVAACKALKEDLATRDIPVIAVSGAVTMIDEVQATEAGFFAHLTKPFKIQDARDTLRRALAAGSRPKG
jgi:signal transduction histidine kinase/ActR/RegA family two-component response regulator